MARQKKRTGLKAAVALVLVPVLFAFGLAFIGKGLTDKIESSTCSSQDSSHVTGVPFDASSNPSGLATQAQKRNAEIAVGVALAHTELSAELRRKLAIIVYIIGRAETNFTNYTSFTDHTSMGVFAQQRWWGTFQQRTNVAESTNLLISGGAKVTSIPGDGSEAGILDISGWKTMAPGDVAWNVQHPAAIYNYRYSTFVNEAEAFVGQIPNGTASNPADSTTQVVSATDCSSGNAALAGSLSSKFGFSTIGSCPAGKNAGTGQTTKAGPPYIQLCTIDGVTVEASIAKNVSDMFAAARKDGITLGGSGYRSYASQVALRRQNCGTSDDAIYKWPSTACSPPTAIPGTSQHNKGHAMDLTCNGGGSISSHSSPCWVWLEENAGRYGLKNYPPEPWHWSTTGT